MQSQDNPRREKKASSRRFPSREEARAVELGADELIALCEWSFRARPRKLRNLRARHVAYCASLLREMERAA
jgi:hypothetical protein